MVYKFEPSQTRILAQSAAAYLTDYKAELLSADPVLVASSPGIRQSGNEGENTIWMVIGNQKNLPRTQTIPLPTKGRISLKGISVRWTVLIEGGRFRHSASVITLN